MAFDIVVRDKISAGIEAKLKRIQAAATGGTTALARMKAQMSGLGSNLGLATTNRGFTNLSRSITAINKKVTTLSSGFSKATNSFRRLLSGALLLQGAEGFVDKLDTFQNLQNRLRTISEVRGDSGLIDQIKSQERLNELTRQMFEVANKARVPVGELANTYRRFDIALKGLGAGQEESLRVLETVAKLLSIGGANANEAGSALLQLSQAFNKAKLDGDEFRSVSELMPAAIDSITKILGISRKEIFDYAEQGKITSEVLRKAFFNLADTVDEQFTRLPRTVSHALAQLSNEITKTFGLSSGGNAFIDAVIRGIDWVAANLPTVIYLMKAFIGTMVVQSVAGFVAQLGSVAGVINLIGQAVSGVIAYFIFFADQITVTEGSLATLQDVFLAFFQELSGGKDILSELFTPAAAQSFFDQMRTGLIFTIDLVTGLIANIKGIYDAFSSLSWKEIAMIPFEAFNATFLFIKNTIIDMFQWILKKGGEFGALLANSIINALRKIISVFATSALSIPVYGEQIKESLVEVFVTLGKMRFDEGEGIDFGLTETLETWRSDMNTFTPSINKFSDAWSKSVNETTTKINDFYDNVLNRAEKTANERIKHEDRVKEAFKKNTDALRGPAGGSTSSTSGASKILEDNGSFRPRPIISGQFKREIDQKKKSIETVDSSLESFNDTLTKTSDISKKATTSIVGLNQGVTGLDFNKAKISVTDYGNTATNVLRNVGNASVSTAGRITSSQTNAWQAATQAVINYANTAIQQLNRIDQSGNAQSSFLASPITTGTRPLYNVGFASGGYTGDGPQNRIAGAVHGQEYVMPASATAKYRPMLDAMRDGSLGGSGGGVTVNIENYGSSQHEVQQIGPNEVRIIAREAVHAEVPGLVATQLTNANSRTSKTMKSSLRANRRR